jgi:hypothetical protein
MNIHRANVDDLIFDYTFEHGQDFLSVSAKSDVHTAVLLTWTPLQGARFTVIKRDPNFDIERQKDASFADFPIREVLRKLELARASFSQADYSKVLDVLKTVHLTGSQVNPLDRPKHGGDTTSAVT